MTPEPLYARCIRTARTWANLSQEELAAELGWEVQAVKRREAGKQEPKRSELLAVASICKVPLAFLERGFPTDQAVTTPAGDPTDERLQELADEVDELRSMHAAHAAQVIERIAALETTIAGRSQPGPPQ